MLSLMAGMLTFTLGLTLVGWGAAVRSAMQHDGTLARAGRLPAGAARELS